MSELKSIHHAAIICSDYEKSKDFYVNKLGLKVIAETYREARKSYKLDLQIGENGGQIELFSFENPPKRPSWPEACGLRHLAFVTNDIEKTVADLYAKGVQTEPIRVDEITGRRFTFFSDPDDLPLELYELG
jgi:glyoxylase I family protein